METSLIHDFRPIRKSEIKQFIAKVTEEVMDDNTDPLLTLAHLKAIEDCIAGIRKNIIQYAISEAAKYGKTAKVHGIEFTMSSRRTFDFSNTARWVELKEELKALEAMLKNLNQPVADPETGEIINPPTFTITEVISITLPE